jgi:two-component system, NtrC family, sensor kinase
MKMRIWIVLFFMFLAGAKCALGQNVLAVDDKAYFKYFGKSVYTFQDETGKLCVSDMIVNPNFAPNPYSVVNFGISNKTNWIKFKIRNISHQEKIVLNVENAIIDDITCYVLSNGILKDSTHIAESDPIASRPFNSQDFLFNIFIPRGDSATVFLKLKSPKQILVPLTIGNEENLLHNISNYDLLSGLYYGIMIVMFLYNLFLFFTVKDISYLYYVNYMFWVGLTQACLQGYAHRFFWAECSWLTKNMLYIVGAASGIGTVIFTKVFLQTKVHAPKMQLFLNGIILFDSIAIFLDLIGNQGASYNVINTTALIGSIIVITVAAKLFNKYRPAKFFLLSYSVFLFGVIVFVLKDVGLLPYSTVTSHSVQLSSALEAILLSFALGDKINTYRKEKEESQAQALAVLQENERIVREQNVVLEQKVKERTNELEISNEGLQKAMTDLKEAEAQLVESEKMASLGQLTAGIAHEINNPINFVTSNIKPLSRDVHMLLDAVADLEKIAVEESPIADKQKKIAKKRKDLEYDYLSIEIAQLLKGISEGATRTADIVKGLKIFSRLDEDTLKKADINEGLESTIVISNHLFDKYVRLEKNYGNLPMIDCYPGKLNQVFLNMITNAVYAIKKKFNGKEGGLLSIKSFQDDNFVFISFADNGTGMDETTKKKLFEPFFTTKDVGEGTGLGLSISHNTISRHNGQIIVNTKLGEGTEFIVKLPKIQK